MNIKDLQKDVIDFRNARAWDKIDNPKDSVMALIAEAAELLEHFKWHSGKETEKYVKNHKEEIADELADVLYWVLTMSHDLEIDLGDAFQKKLKKNAKKYPVK